MGFLCQGTGHALAEGPHGTWNAISVPALTHNLAILGLAMMLKIVSGRCWASQMVLVGKNPLPMQTQEDGTATHIILSWEIPWTEERARLHPWGCEESDLT